MILDWEKKLLRNVNTRIKIKMKIIFLCGALEPGRDGVGDYTRRLAGCLIRQNHEIAIVALNDQFISEEVDGVQVDGESEISILRLPSSVNEKMRFRRAKNWINDFSPDIISLQFVPYSFHRKGLPWNLGRCLKELDSKSKWHIMFHELWLDNPTNYKQRIVSFFQKKIIKRLVSQLDSKINNVSIEFNQDRLKKIGINSELLGLFGNIQKSPSNSCNKFYDGSLSNEVRILYFGAAPKGALVGQIIEGLEDFYKKKEQLVHLIMVGGESKAKKEFINSLKKKRNLKIKITDLGFLESEEVSKILDCVNVGIIRSAGHLIGKSGTAIAMLEFGLPIWAPKLNDDKNVMFDFRPELIHSDLIKAFEAKRKNEYIPRLPLVSEIFINYLKE